MTKASDNAFPSILITEGTEPSAPAAGKQRLYVDSTTHVLMIVNSSGTESAVATAGAMATDALWDAAGDLAVGTGANTGAKLSKGAAGGHLSIINGAVAWDSGTSFPASKLTGDRFWRTDLGMDFYWNGTYWLTVADYVQPYPTADTITVNGTSIAMATVGVRYQMFLVEIITETIVVTTNDGTKYWTIQFLTKQAPNTGTNLGSSFNTSADTATTHTQHRVTIGAVLATTELLTYFTYTKTSTPGTLFLTATLLYKLIGT